MPVNQQELEGLLQKLEGVLPTDEIEALRFVLNFVGEKIIDNIRRDNARVENARVRGSFEEMIVRDHSILQEVMTENGGSLEEMIARDHNILQEVMAENGRVRATFQEVMAKNNAAFQKVMANNNNAREQMANDNATEAIQSLLFLFVIACVAYLYLRVSQDCFTFLTGFTNIFLALTIYHTIASSLHLSNFDSTYISGA